MRPGEWVWHCKRHEMARDMDGWDVAAAPADWVRARTWPAGIGQIRIPRSAFLPEMFARRTARRVPRVVTELGRISGHSREK